MPKYYRANEDLAEGSEVQLDEEGKLVLYTNGRRLGVLNKAVSKGKKVASAEIGFVPRETYVAKEPTPTPIQYVETKTYDYVGEITSSPEESPAPEKEVTSGRKPWWWGRKK